jgi:murein peptide amidase A
MPTNRTKPRGLTLGRSSGLLLCVLTLAATTVVHAPVAGAAGEAQREDTVVGTSAQGRPIVAVHRWRAGATKRVLVIGNMHGDERAGLRVVSRLVTRRLPTNVDLWLIRSINPDGTAADRRTNARGVDLNRNFPRRWVRAGRGTTQWAGPSAASEPETTSLMAFVRKVRPRTTVVFHQPLYGVDSYRAKSPALVRALSHDTGLPVKSFDCRGGCHGTFTDWLNDRTAGRAVTVEFGHRASAARLDRVARAVLRVGSRT